MVKVPIWAYYCMNSCVQPEQDPPVYYSIVILTILYYLRVADLMEITLNILVRRSRHSGVA